MNLLSTVGMAIGTALSGITFRELGFWGVYTTTAALYAGGIVYGSVFIKEVPASDGSKTDRGGTFDGFFDAKHVKEAFGVTFKDGPHNRRLRIVMLMLIAFLIIGPLNGSYQRR